MSWKYPFSELTTGGVVEIDGLNRGFLESVNEVQGQLNEHNWIAGAVASEEESPAGSVTQIIGNYTPDTHLVDDAFFEYVTNSPRQVSVGRNMVANMGEFTLSATDPYNGMPWKAFNNVDGIGGLGSPAFTALGSPGTGLKIGGGDWAQTWYIPGDALWHRIGKEEKANFDGAIITFNLAEQTTLWLLSSCQWLGPWESCGSMFGLRLNGDILTESVIGSGDTAIDPYNMSEHADMPEAERMQAAPNMAPNTLLGYPFCVEAVVTVPAGISVVESVVRRCAFDSMPNGIGSVELIVLKIMR